MLFLPFYFFTFLPFKKPLTIQFYKFLECSECIATIDALSCNLHAFLNTLLSLLHNLNTEGGIGKYDILLGRQCTVLKYGIKDFLSLFLCGTTSNFLWFSNFKTKILWLEDALIMIGRYLEITGQGISS